MVFGVLLLMCAVFMLITCFASIGKDPGYAIAVAFFTTAFTPGFRIFSFHTSYPGEAHGRRTPSLYVRTSVLRRLVAGSFLLPWDG